MHPKDQDKQVLRVGNEAPTPTSDQRVIHRFADLGDWLDKGRVIDALEERSVIDALEEEDPVPAYSDSKVFESKVRRQARQLGYVVHRTRRQLPPHIGGYMLRDARGGYVLGSWYDATIEQVAAYLDCVTA